MKIKSNNFEMKIRNDWHYLKKIRSKDITEHLCDMAFSINYESIKYIPNRYKEKYSIEVMRQNILLYNYCNVKSLTLDNWKEILFNITFNYINLKKAEKLVFEKMAEYLADTYDDNEINSFLEKNFEAEIIKKKFINGKFIVTKMLSTIYKRINYIFNTFDEFYSFLNGDLSNADVYAYNFEGIDLKKYEIDNVAINSTILIKNGLYDDSFYNEIIKSLIIKGNELIKTNDINVSIPHEINVLPYQSSDFTKKISLYYISDIHIDSKIAVKFKEYATKKEVEYYVKTLVDTMFDSLVNDVGEKYLLIAGDVSSNFELSKIFYQKLVDAKRISSKNIICILGNHELWNLDRASDNNVESIIQLYKKMFNELGITFLQNELLVIDGDFKIIKESKIKSMNLNDLKKVTLESRLIILGGIGFSGYNPDFNASKLIYRDAVKSLDEDKKLTKKFNRLYTKLKENIFNRKIIILTHHPKHDWSTDNYNPNWIYINGHTHKNIYEKNQDKQLYADNQIGYFNENLKLKRISYSLKCNIFNDYEDGIHLISLEQYLLFYRKMGYIISCKLVGNFYLLKKNNIFMFIYKNKKGNIYILNGGIQNKLGYKEIEYYYDNMKEYSNIVKNATKSFYEYLNQLSEYIKAIGGSGTIHGTIIDIDYYAHIYINIYDGTITPYWARSMDCKVIYSSIKELLINHCPLLLKNIDNSPKKELVVMKNELIPQGGEFYENTRIYKESRIMKQIQYLIDDDIIRIWNEDILKDKKIKLLSD